MIYEHAGFCPCCETNVTFRASGPWLRSTLRCPTCDSVVRERALALVLEEIMPDWRDAAIHESSPMPRGISKKLREQARNYLASQYFPSETPGAVVRGFRNENLEAQTFVDGSFDLVVSLDVMEHVFHPDRAYAEIWRTLRPGGLYIHTFPIMKTQTAATRRRATLEPDGTVTHLVQPPEYHGNPVDLSGSLVTFDYGYDLPRQIAEWAPFDVRIMRFWDQTHGVVGEFTEVVVCRRKTGNGNGSHLRQG